MDSTNTPTRYPTAAQLNMTQQEAMAIIFGQREEIVALKANIMIVTKCVEDLGRHCVDQQAQIVSMTENMVTMDNMDKVVKNIAEIKKEVAEFKTENYQAHMDMCTNMCAKQHEDQAKIASACKSIAKIEENLSEKEHPLRYVLGALRNDLSSTASSVQYLTDKLNKSNEDFTQLAMAFVRFQGKVGAELPATVEHPRYRKRTSAVNEAFTSNMEQPPMLVPVPTVPMLAAEVEELE